MLDLGLLIFEDWHAVFGIPSALLAGTSTQQKQRILNCSSRSNELSLPNGDCRVLPVGLRIKTPRSPPAFVSSPSLLTIPQFHRSYLTETNGS